MILRDFIIMIITIGFVVFAMVGFSGTLNSYYGVEVEGNYTAIYDSINESVSEGISLTEDIQRNVAGSERGGIIGTVTTISSGIYNALKLPFEAVKVLVKIFSAFFSVIPFPSWVVNGIVILLVITITFLILGAILRHKI